MKIVKQGRGNNTVRPLTEEEQRAEQEYMAGLFRESAERDARARQRIIQSAPRYPERILTARERNAEMDRNIRRGMPVVDAVPIVPRPIPIGTVADRVSRLDDDLNSISSSSSGSVADDRIIPRSPALPVSSSYVPPTISPRRTLSANPNDNDRFRHHSIEYLDLNQGRTGRGLLDNEAEAMRNVLAMRKIVRKMPISRR